MRTWMAVSLLAIPVLLAATSASQRPAAAGESARWCYMGNDPGTINCSQPSFEMCLFQTLGAGGHCYAEGPARPPYREAVNYRTEGTPRREAANYRAPYREAVNYRTAYVDPMGGNGRARPAYAAQPFYEPKYQRAYYERASYQPVYQPAIYQPSYINPPPARMRPAPTRWCYVGTEPGTVDCGQPSFEMCLFSTFGSGGYCYQEQAVRGPSRLRAAGVRPIHHVSHRAPRVADAGNAASASVAKAAAQKSGAQAYAMADSNSATDATLEASPVKAAAPITAAALKDFPKFNVASTCREAAHIGMDPERDTAVCVQDENEARDQLVQQWNGFAADDRTSCKRLTTSTGGGTYTELATCLEMRQFARNANKDTSALATAR
jgi:hypothetical protein